MYLSVFMIKDNYGKFQNVANALVENEMVSTYTWILQCLMKATNNTVLKAFWTDSEPGLINAATYIFPMTLHFYCLFHTLNSASNLCKIENTIDKRHEDEFQYCKLANLKAYQITQKFQISQSFIYEGYLITLISSLNEIIIILLKLINLDIKTASDNFIEDIIDELQITIKSLLSGIEISNIIEIWKIRCIAIETTTDTSTLSQITSCTFQSLHYIQRSDNNEIICQNTNQRNRFGIAFSIAKTAVNIALETNSDRELIQLLKDFIEAKRKKNVDNNDNVNHDIVEINGSNQENDNIVLLQKNLIEQITSSCVTKVKGVL
ncbi:unnamed protein product [Rhizophagus irregularis]|nr:unnamed protein product [Rhizophagus irregularis]